MNIVILSGGSGNDSLIKGLKSFYPRCDIKVIVNAYDNGKSTGICRQITNTLGVSDIRKNHARLYETLTPDPNQCVLEFYNNRYDIKSPKDVEELLYNWGMDDLIPFSNNFFSRAEARTYNFNCFNISNIIYSELYNNYGYEYVNNMMCSRFGIDDFVLLNSFDNVYLTAKTTSGRIIADEADIVEYCNAEDKIIDVQFFADNDLTYMYNAQELNPVAICAIQAADLLVISTGTFWSSIYPTLKYGDFYTYINNSEAKKIWAINNTEDKDAYGVTADEFIHYMYELGLDLSTFKILLNTDAVATLSTSSTQYDVKKWSMENVEGKHNSVKYARAILSEYYEVHSYDSYLFDFDDTLWARDSKKKDVSIENIKLLSQLGSKATIVSGNSYNSIIQKLRTVLGTNPEGYDFYVCADANAVEYCHGNVVDVIKAFTFDTSTIRDYLRKRYAIHATTNEHRTFLKIKPLQPRERILAVDLLNEYLLPLLNCSCCVAKSTGKTTIDIVHKSNTKGAWFALNERIKGTTLYVGDEFDNGNDTDIAKSCTHAIHTSGVDETNTVLRLIV